jgi:hypothetical protein
MDLEEATKKLLQLEVLTQGQGFIDNPVTMSRTMARMSAYTGAIETKLAEYEKDYEIQQSQLYRKLLIDEKLAATAAEKHVKIELGELRGQVAYFTRIIASAWRQIGVLQSRINHIVKLSETTNL